MTAIAVGKIVKRFLSVLSIVLVGLVVGALPAFADGLTEDDKRASCSTREAPDKIYKGEAWAVYRDDGKGNWIVTNIGYTIRSVGLPVQGDNQINVRLVDFSRGMTDVGSYEYQRVSNADLKTQSNISPSVTVPKGKLGVYLTMVTSMDSLAKSCTAASMVF